MIEVPLALVFPLKERYAMARSTQQKTSTSWQETSRSSSIYTPPLAQNRTLLFKLMPSFKSLPHANIIICEIWPITIHEWWHFINIPLNRFVLSRSCHFHGPKCWVDALSFFASPDFGPLFSCCCSEALPTWSVAKQRRPTMNQNWHADRKQ